MAVLGRDYVLFGIHTQTDSADPIRFAHYTPLHNATSEEGARTVVTQQVFGATPTKQFGMYHNYFPTLDGATGYNSTSWILIKESGNRGSIPVFDIKPNHNYAGGGHIKWNQFDTTTHYKNDSTLPLIVTDVDKVISNCEQFSKTYGLPIYIAIHGECWDESDERLGSGASGSYGTSADYRQMYRFWWDRIKNQNAYFASHPQMLLLGWNQTAYHVASGGDANYGAATNPDNYFPGPPVETQYYCDVIGLDAYNTAGNNPNDATGGARGTSGAWRTFEETVSYASQQGSFYIRNPVTWIRSKDGRKVSWGVWETSCIENWSTSPPATKRKPRWIADMDDTITTWNAYAASHANTPLFTHLLWFHTWKDGEGEYYFDSPTPTPSPDAANASRDAFIAQLNSAYWYAPTGGQTAQVTIAGQGAVTAVGRKNPTASVTISGVGAVTESSSRVTSFASPTIAGAGVLSTVTQPFSFATSTLSALGDVTAKGFASLHPTIMVSGAGTVTASGSVSASTTGVHIDGASSLIVVPQGADFATLSIDGVGSVAASSLVATSFATATIAGTSSLSITGATVPFATVTITGTGDVVVSSAQKTSFATVNLAGIGRVMVVIPGDVTLGVEDVTFLAVGYDPVIRKMATT